MESDQLEMCKLQGEEKEIYGNVYVTPDKIVAAASKVKVSHYGRGRSAESRVRYTDNTIEIWDEQGKELA